MQKLTSLVLFILLYTNGSYAQSNFIHVDQFGYPTTADKVAVLSNPQIGFNDDESYSPAASLEVRNADDNSVIMHIPPQAWNGGATHDQSGDSGWWLDFSTLTNPGQYYIYDVLNNESSAIFQIDDIVYNEVMTVAARAFYYNRCNMAKNPPYAQANWADGNNFLNALQDANCRYIHDQNNAALEKDLSGGWFDAGDYNKYVTFAFSVIHNLLSAYEENPQAFSDNWNIPESGNGIPDIIDEIKWELDWLLKMNNADGSTHIKMGSQNHQDNSQSPPSACVDQRFYGPTCTSASIAVASNFAHAAKVFSQFSSLTGYAELLELRAIQSWDYVLPYIIGNGLETNCDNGEIVSGDADWSVSQQLENAVIASLRLYDLTGTTTYRTYFESNYDDTEPFANNFWGAYKIPLYDALLRYTNISGSNTNISNTIINSFATDASNNWNGYYGFNDDDLYRAYMPSWSYHWGSNMPKASYGILNQLLIQYNINPGQHANYEKYILEVAHYFHGVNPMGLTYLSNMSSFGAERSCNEIYHTWFADGSVWDNASTSLYGPAPGFVPGGPNHDFSITSLTPPSGQPDQKSYLDFNTNWPDNSWEITEPAIYYQAAYIRMLANLVDADGVSSIGNIKASPVDIKIYPNPTNQYFTLRGDLASYDIDLINELGQVITNLNTTNSEIIVDTSTLGAGIFFIRLHHTMSNALSVQKIIKMN